MRHMEERSYNSINCLCLLKAHPSLSFFPWLFLLLHDIFPNLFSHLDLDLLKRFPFIFMVKTFFLGFYLHSFLKSPHIILFSYLLVYLTVNLFSNSFLPPFFIFSFLASPSVLLKNLIPAAVSLLISAFIHIHVSLHICTYFTGHYICTLYLYICLTLWTLLIYMYIQLRFVLPAALYPCTNLILCP